MLTVVAIAGGPGRGHDSSVPASLAESERSVLRAHDALMFVKWEVMR